MTRFQSLEAAHDYIDELEELIRQYRAMLMPEAKFPHKWRLTRQEAKVLRCLVVRSQVQRDHIMQMLYDDASERDIRVVDQYVKRVRAKLHEHKLGIVIEPIYGVGYTIPEEGRQKLRSFLMVDHQEPT